MEMRVWGTIFLDGGDIYIINKKTRNNDWKCSSIYTL